MTGATNVEIVVANILAREHMPVPQDIHDGTGRNGAGGQTPMFLATYNLPFPNTEPEAASNLVMFFAKTGLLSVINASVALGDAVADYAYAVSVRGAVRALQAVLGVTQDGIMGPVTMDALHQQPDLAGLVRDIAIARLKTIGQGLASGQTKPEFASGLVDRAVSFL
jgi:murein L,D-transpeptidase YcbB/YkuD